jgi:hypothetical protein
MNSKLYTTGYITEDENNLRIKQGLLQQNISNICSINLTNVSQCNQKNLYPSGVVQMDTVTNIPIGSACLNNFRSP